MANSIKIRLKRKKDALAELFRIENNPGNYVIIHYSSESFYDVQDGGTPRITSIAVRSFKTGQTTSFSIHKVAETKRVPVKKIRLKYDYLEKEMLHEFFKYVNKNQSMTWIHWNMRDINYGFQALEHRFRTLKGKPIILNDENKLDLSKQLINIFGNNYAFHPRFKNLIELNKMSRLDFLSGAEEAISYQKGEYVKLHQSTLRKVDILNSIVIKLNDGTLKTKSKFWEVYGLSPQGIYELCKDHWLFGILSFGIGTLVGALLGNILK